MRGLAPPQHRVKKPVSLHGIVPGPPVGVAAVMLGWPLLWVYPGAPADLPRRRVAGP